jgi:hypothetical protein
MHNCALLGSLALIPYLGSDGVLNTDTYDEDYKRMVQCVILLLGPGGARRILQLCPLSLPAPVRSRVCSAWHAR